MNRNFIFMPLLLLCIPAHGMLTALSLGTRSQILAPLMSCGIAMFNANDLHKHIEIGHDKKALQLIDKFGVIGTDQKKQTLKNKKGDTSTETSRKKDSATYSRWQRL